MYFDFLNYYLTHLVLFFLSLLILLFQFYLTLASLLNK